MADGCDRSLCSVSKGARANNCHGPRLALIRHWVGPDPEKHTGSTPLQHSAAVWTTASVVFLTCDRRHRDRHFLARRTWAFCADRSHSSGVGCQWRHSAGALYLRPCLERRSWRAWSARVDGSRTARSEHRRERCSWRRRNAAQSLPTTHTVITLHAHQHHHRTLSTQLTRLTPAPTATQ